MRHMRSLAGVVGIGLVLGLGAGAAQAQSQQEGLVNVAVEDVTIQLPIAVAANVCDVNVAVLAELADEAGTCTATADSAASAGPSGNGNVRQEGLVNVLIDDVVVQAPIALAANICDVNVAVLARVLDDASACEAVAGADAQPGSGQGGRNAAAFDPIDLSAIADLSFLDNDLTSMTGSPTPIF
jgi:hypothetical protein